MIKRGPMKPYICGSAGQPDWVSWWFGGHLVIIWRKDYHDISVSLRLGPLDLMFGVTSEDLYDAD